MAEAGPADAEVQEVHWERAGCPVCAPPGDVPAAASPQFLAPDHLFGRPGVFSLVRCPGCGSLRVDPRPTADSLGFYYVDYYTPEGQRDAEALQLGVGGDVPSNPVRKLALRRWQEIRRRLPAPGGRPAPGPAAGAADRWTVLDVGCGLGGFLHHLTTAEPSVAGLGVEDAARAVRFAREELGLDVHEGRAERLPWPDGCADVVTLWHVLEHSPAPTVALAEAYRVLRPGGVLAVEVPHGGSLLLTVFRRRWFFLQPPTHLHLFTERALRQLVRRAGFVDPASSFPFVPLELLGSLLLAVFRPRGLRHRPPRMLALVAIALAVLLVETPLLLLLGRLRRSGVVRLFARKPEVADPGAAPTSAGSARRGVDDESPPS
ncbi:MAG: methyltransferase domain-containing protein [Myxococcota bacterium]|jgi:SAM-dependent methyltransferase|nr:methyltransferase domain-containing protein [Myxococcota bacterium]